MKSVEDEWERKMESDEDLDLLFVSYDAQLVTVDKLIEFIKEQGFEAKVKENGTQP